MKNYIGYCRVSNKEHENSIPAQKKILEEFASRKGFKLKKIYVEKKSAFGKTNRKIFTEMIKHLEGDNIEGVLFHKVDRSARNMKDFARLEKFFDLKDVRVIEGEFDTSSAQGRFQFRIFCSMAVWYSENLSEEVNTKMEGCLRRGFYPSVAPIGYKSLGKGKKVPDKYFSLVRESFLLYEAGQHPVRALVKHMNSKGLRNKAGNKMSKNTLLTMLKNPFYYGDMKFGKYPLYKGNHEPCISKTLYERVQNRIAGKVNRTPGIFRNHAYNRLIRYEGKGFLVGAVRRGKTYYEVHNYDRNKIYFRIDKTPKKYLSEVILDERFKELFALLRFRKDFFSNFLQALETAKEEHLKTAPRAKKEQLELIDREVEKTEARLKNLKKRLLDGVFSDKEYAELKSEFEAEIEELAERRNEFLDDFDLESVTKDQEFLDTVENFVKLPKLISEKYYCLDSDMKRELLELFFESFEVNAGLLKVKPSQLLEALLELKEISPLERQKTALPKGLTSSGLKKLLSGRATLPPFEPGNYICFFNLYKKFKEWMANKRNSIEPQELFIKINN